jgi:hypothetical protein
MTSATYIFAYGSLISQVSRSHTGESGPAFACRISGFQRDWCYIPDDSINRTWQCVGCTPASSPSTTVNGCITAVPPAELPSFDKREYGYKRVSLPLEQLEFVEPKDNDLHQLLEQQHATVYIYVVAERLNQKIPLIQSYIDVIMDGCLNVSEEYAIEFVKTTGNWDNAVWLNDRLNVQYVRPLNYDNLVDGRVEQIDTILHEHAPKAMKQRQSVSVSLESLMSVASR